MQIPNKLLELFENFLIWPNMVTLMPIVLEIFAKFVHQGPILR